MNNTNNNADFDFDELARLAKENPDAFEDKRKQLIQEVIDKSSPEIRRRMQGLQWQIDQIRSTADNPMASCLKISNSPMTVRGFEIANTANSPSRR